MRTYKDSDQLVTVVFEMCAVNTVMVLAVMSIVAVINYF